MRYFDLSECWHDGFRSGFLDLFTRIAYFNLCVTGVEASHCEDSKRSSVPCIGSFHSKGDKARPRIYFLCRRRWFMCLYFSLNNRNNERRLRNRMKCHCGKYHVPMGFWPFRLRCYFLPVVVTQRLWLRASLALTPVGGSIFLFYGMWWPVPGFPVWLGNWKLKARCSHPHFKVRILLFYDVNVRQGLFDTSVRLASCFSIRFKHGFSLWSWVSFSPCILIHSVLRLPKSKVCLKVGAGTWRRALWNAVVAT